MSVHRASVHVHEVRIQVLRPFDPSATFLVRPWPTSRSTRASSRAQAARLGESTSLQFHHPLPPPISEARRRFLSATSLLWKLVSLGELLARTPMRGFGSSDGGKYIGAPVIRRTCTASLTRSAPLRLVVVGGMATSTLTPRAPCVVALTSRTRWTLVERRRGEGIPDVGRDHAIRTTGSFAPPSSTSWRPSFIRDGLALWELTGATHVRPACVLKTRYGADGPRVRVLLEGLSF